MRVCPATAVPDDCSGLSSATYFSPAIQPCRRPFNRIDDTPLQFHENRRTQGRGKGKRSITATVPPLLSSSVALAHDWVATLSSGSASPCSSRVDEVALILGHLLYAGFPRQPRLFSS